jgi:hypothetical protein
MGAAVALGFSGGYGESATEECRQPKQTRVSCTSGVEEACRTLQERKQKRRAASPRCQAPRVARACSTALGAGSRSRNEPWTGSKDARVQVHWPGERKPPQ